MSYVRSAPATTLLLIVLVAVFGVEIALGAVESPRRLLRLGALPSTGNVHGELWRFATYSLLHLNLTHLVTNVALLVWVGRIVERRVGTARLLLVYIVSVLLAGLAIAFKDAAAPSIGVSVGASGGVLGLLSASIMLVFRPDMAQFGQDRGVRIGLLACLAIAVWMSFLPDVSFAGHLGGLVAGIVLGLVAPARDGVPTDAAAVGARA